MYCWIQITVEEQLIQRNSEYRYKDTCTGKEMVEYHVDHANFFRR